MAGRWILALLLWVFVPSWVQAQSGSALQVGQLQVTPSVGSMSPVAVGHLGGEVERRTSIRMDSQVPLVPLEGNRLALFPLLFLPVREPLPMLGLKELGALSEWFVRGGMLVVDWQGGGGQVEQFRASLESWVTGLFPGATLSRIPRGCVLYRSFYRVEMATGRLRLVDDLYGVELDGRFVLVVSFNNMLATVERGRDGAFVHEVLPGGETQREQSVRLLVNLVVYALCLDYKDDRLHLDFLRSRRNWQLPGEEH